MSVAIIEQTNIKARANQALQDARELAITTQDGYIGACEARKALKAIEKDILETHNPVVEHWFSKHKQAVADKFADLQPVQEAGRIIGAKMAEWDTVQEVIRRAEESRLRELGRQQEETRLLAEAAAREEEARHLAESAARLYKIAQEFANKGLSEEADSALLASERSRLEAESAIKESEATLQEAISAPAPVVFVPKETPKVKGISYTTRWDFEVVDASLIPDEYKMPDLGKIRKVVDAMKSLTKIPGIRAYAKKIPNTRI